MVRKKKIKREEKKEVENKVEDKKQVVNRTMLKMVRIVVAYMNLIDGRGIVYLEEAIEETSKLLATLVQTNKTVSWKVKEVAGTGDQNNKSL